eukprot:g6075.t1
MLALALLTLAAASPTAVDLAVNGLLAHDVAFAPFPSGGSFVLSWAVDDITTASPAAFVVELAAEGADFPSAARLGDASGLQWSSGIVKSSTTSLMLPGNLTARLVPESTYAWRVQLCSSSSAASCAPFSTAAAFDVAPDAAAWDAAAWIGGGSELRTDFALPAGRGGVVRARAYTAGLGAFDFFVNGHKIGDHIMDAGEAVYDQKTLFVGFNVTAMLRAGATNAVGARLGNGKWGYLDIYVNRTALGDQSGDSSRAFRLLLRVTLADGSQMTLTSQPGVAVPAAGAGAGGHSAAVASGWACRHGPIVYDHLWHGEIYDQRQEAAAAIGGWVAAPLASYAPGTWAEPAVAMSPLAGDLFPQLMPPIRVVESFDAAEVLHQSTRCNAPALGGTAMEGASLYLACEGDIGVIAAIEFASYGTPAGTGDPSCGAFAEVASCAAPNTLAVVQKLCVNRSSCVVPADSLTYGNADPCEGTVKSLAVRARGSPQCKPAAPPAAARVNASMLADFGHNMAGFTTLSLDAAALRAAVPSNDTVVAIRLKHTEIRSADGEAFNNYYPGMEFNHASATCDMKDWYARKWYECANQTDMLVLQPSTVVGASYDFTPSYTYHGFRFVEVSAVQLGANGEEQPLSGGLAAAFPFGAELRAHRANSDVRRLASIDLEPKTGTSAAAGDVAADTGAVEAARIVGAIFNATIASHISNLWSIPTDCPQREKRGWMGDAGISADSLNTYFDAEAFHVNFLRLIRDNQRKLCVDQPHTSIYGPCSANGHNATTWLNGSVPDVTPFPTGPYGGNPGSTDWQVAYVLIARALLLHHGDRVAPALADLWPSLDLLMAYFDRLVDADSGLLLVGARGDWIPPEGNGRGPYPTPTAPISAFFHTLCVSYMAEIATAVGRSDDAARYTARLAKNRAAYHKKFFNNGGSALRGERCCYDKGSQTSNIFALHLGVVPPEHVNATLGMLVASIYDREATKPAPLGSAAQRQWRQQQHVERHRPANPPAVVAAVPQLPRIYETRAGFVHTLPAAVTATPAWGPGAHMDCGIFGTTYIFDVLHAHGQDAAGLAILTETSYPSFGYMISQNATTLWEAWDGDVHNIGGGGTSRNHIMFGGGVNRFISAAVGGLSIDTRPMAAAEAQGRGWRRLMVRLAPAAVRTLGRSGASRRTPLGDAAVSWRRDFESGGLSMEVTVPAYATASVHVPLLDLARGGGRGARVRFASGAVAAGHCVALCGPASVGVAGAAAVTGISGPHACSALLAGARCSTRADGEGVLIAELPAGRHTLRAERA